MLLTLDSESRSISQKRPPYGTMPKNHLKSERHVDDPLVGVPQLRARNCKWTNAACDLSPGRPGTTSKPDIKRLDGTGKNTVRELCWSLNALQDREDESGGTAKKARRHKQWNIYQAGGNIADSALHVQTVNAAIVVFGMHLTVRLKATCSLLPLLHVCPLLFPGNLVCTVWLFTLYF